MKKLLIVLLLICLPLSAMADDPAVLSYLSFTNAPELTLKTSEQRSDGSRSLYYKGDFDTFNNMEDYVALLVEELDATVTNHVCKERKNYRHSEWYLDFPFVTSTKAGRFVGDEDAHLVIWLNQYGDLPSSGVSFFAAEGLSLADDGVAGSSASGSSSGDSVCGKCFGSGKCNNCNGSGSVRKLLAGTTRWINQNCSFCVGGKCSECHGSGR